MWSSDSTVQGSRYGSASRDPTKVNGLLKGRTIIFILNYCTRVNVPGLSNRVLQMGIASSEVITGAKIQVCIHCVLFCVFLCIGYCLCAYHTLI